MKPTNPSKNKNFENFKESKLSQQFATCTYKQKGASLPTYSNYIT